MSDDTEFGTEYRFVPYARRGYRPSTEFQVGNLTGSSRPAIGIDVTPSATPRDGSGTTEGETQSLELSMYGPGDVRGIDRSQIVRVEPDPGNTLQPNYFPFVEFDRPDLPWMFSLERDDRQGRVRPWLSLITVTDTEGVSVSTGDGRPLSVLRLGDDVDLARERPDGGVGGAGEPAPAHASPRGESQSDWYGSGTQPSGWLYEQLQERSNLTRSRIVSPRNLDGEEDYVACLVPTFEPGRLAGLGRDPYPSGGRASASDVELAWDHDDLPEPPFEIPVYHHWRFSASAEGTFEKYVEALNPEELGPEVGKKDVDVRDPGPDSLVPTGDAPGKKGDPDADDPRTVAVAGAMCSVPAREAVEQYAKRDRLRELLNKPETLTTGSSRDAQFPVVGPPLYGQWHAGLQGIPDASTAGDYDPTWFRQLNQNVHNRVAASVGVGIVQEHQNQLMDAAWEVVGKVREANKFTRSTQSAEVIGNAIENPEQFDIDQEERVGAPETSPGETRREFERIKEIADRIAGGPDGIPGTGGDGTDLGGIGGDDDGPAVGGGGEWGGGDWGGGRGGGGWGGGRFGGNVGGPNWGGGGPAVTPIEGLSLGGSSELGAGGSMAVPLAYLGGGTSNRNDARPDGGAAADTGADSPELTDGATYVEYLRAFLLQPETSLSYQRLVRLDGPLARRTGYDADDYGDALQVASRRARQEVGALLDARPDRRPGEFGDEPPTDGHPEAPASGDVGGEAADVGPASVPEPDTGIDLRGRGALPPAASLPNARTVASRQRSRSALDDRMADLGVEQPDASPQPGDRGPADRDPGAESVRGILDGIQDHVVTVEDNLRACRSASDGVVDSPGGSTTGGEHGPTGGDHGSPGEHGPTGDDDGSPGGSAGGDDSRGRGSTPGEGGRSVVTTTLAAYDAARRIVYSLDPLDRAVSKAVADPDVTVAESLTEDRAGELLREIRTAHWALLSALSEAHRRASDGEEGTTGDRSSDGPSGDGDREPDGSTGASGTVDPALSDADEALTGLRGGLDDLAAELRLTAEPTTPMSLRSGPSNSPLSGIEPRGTSVDGVALEGIRTRLTTGGEGRYRKTMMADGLSFLKTADFVKDDDPVESVMVAPEFPTPTWRLLKEYDESFVLPGAGGIDKGTVGLLVENREFIESYMTGLSHEMARELLWREYPTDRKGTYFRRFWNKGKGPGWEPGSAFNLGKPESKDITPIHEWDTAELGENAPGQTGSDKIFLLVRGKLFERYPNTVVYAARAQVVDTADGLAVEPVTPEQFVKNKSKSSYDANDVKFPTFRGKIGGDMTFIGFDLTVDEVEADPGEITGVADRAASDPQALVADMEDSDTDVADDLGWYFVFEERPGETRFGLDEGTTDDVGKKPDVWDDVSWYHTVDSADDLESTSYLSVTDSRPWRNDWSRYKDPEEKRKGTQRIDWGRNSAHMATITWQKPVRTSYHANEMLPDEKP